MQMLIYKLHVDILARNNCVPCPLRLRSYRVSTGHPWTWGATGSPLLRKGANRLWTCLWTEGTRELLLRGLLLHHWQRRHQRLRRC